MCLVKITISLPGLTNLVLYSICNHYSNVVTFPLTLQMFYAMHRNLSPSVCVSFKLTVSPANFCVKHKATYLISFYFVTRTTTVEISVTCKNCHKEIDTKFD